MAKGKQAAALFEVISKSRRYQKPAEIRSGTPAWWPFGKRKSSPQPAARVLPKPIGAGGASASARAPLPASEPLIPIHTETMEASHDAYMSSLDGNERDWEREPVSSSVCTLPSVEDPLRKPLDVAIDPERRVIAFRMSYTVAIVGGFAVLVAVYLAVVVGQHLRGESAPLMTASIQKLQAGPAHPEVLEVPRRNAIVASGVTTVRNAGSAAPASQQIASARVVKPTFNEPRPPTNFSANDGKRYIGLNYVIVQMYAATEEKMAQEACEFLNKNGVECSIEKGLKGWPPSAFIVVGNHGFDRISTAPFKEYVAQIEKLSTQYAGTTKSYKAFQPSPKKWDKQG